MPAPETLHLLPAEAEAYRAANTPQQPVNRVLPGPQGLVLVAAAVAGARLGLRPISDNSALVHLRTGIELLHTGHVPRTDPYSFTAGGHPWVVQSWLASLFDGAANAVGHHALVFEQAVLMALTAVVIALTARGPTALRTGLAATVAIAASAPGWSPRPLIFELICLSLTILIVERRAHPAWLIPVVWLWANTHGSYPIGLAWLGARALGEAIDVHGWPRATMTRLAAFVAGLVVALLNPIGWRLLAFPIVALQKRSTFQGIVEWRSPNFQNPNTFVALIFVVVAFVVLLRAALPWGQLLPVCVFLTLALVAVRNLAPLGVVLAPALACALRSPAPSARCPRVVALGGSVAWRAASLGVAAVVAVGLVVVAVRHPTLNLASYPVSAVNHLEATGRLGPGHRIAAADVVGCFLIWRAGPATKVFIDDRYDMYPAAVVADARSLADAAADAGAVLDRRRVDTVVWAAAGILPGELLKLGSWRQDYRDRDWVVLVRDSSAL